MKRSRRILLLITDLEIGGTPTVVRELARRLHDPPAVQIDVACLKGDGPVAGQLRSLGIRVVNLNARGVFDLPIVIRRLLREIDTREYDTIVSFLMHANAVAAITCSLRRGVRLIESIQTTQPNPAWHWTVQSLAQRAANCVLVPSISVARMAIDRADVSPIKIAIISNAIDLKDFARKNIDHPITRIGFIGRLDPVKRLPMLISALIALPDVHLNIFGDGAERARIEAMVTLLDLSHRVTMHGTIDDPAKALSQIDLLVLPSLAEGFGLVLIEAMAAGVPIVATNVPGIRDVVQHESTGLLVDSSDPADLAHAIRRVINDPALRKTLITNGLREARERFSWEKIIVEYRRLLQLAD